MRITVIITHTWPNHTDIYPIIVLPAGVVFHHAVMSTQLLITKYMDRLNLTLCCMRNSWKAFFIWTTCEKSKVKHWQLQQSGWKKETNPPPPKKHVVYIPKDGLAHFRHYEQTQTVKISLSLSGFWSSWFEHYRLLSQWVKSELSVTLTDEKNVPAAITQLIKPRQVD